ncbi:DUF805 domain-containing protein [Maricaulis sp. CAU 1757]
MTAQDFIIDRQQATRILFGSDGRLAPQEFAQGLVAILAAWVLIQLFSLLPLIGGLIAVVGFFAYLVLAYAWVCTFSKRFHDAGRSGWLTVPMVLAYFVIAALVAFVISPLVGGPDLLHPGYSAMRTGIVLQSILVGLIVNGGLGYYMYTLPRKPID